MDRTDASSAGHVRSMLEAMKYRGPDGFDLRHSAPDACLGSVRLAIVDPDHSHQPISDPSGRVHLVYNGEIYNYRELRRELSGRGYRFHTGGDGEVILALYREHGTGFAHRLDGMFAFALWDSGSRQLLLGRDRVGIKPMFYWTGGGALVFGSEVPALAVHPMVPHRVDAAAMAGFTAYRFCPPPGSALQGVSKVEPGTVLSFGSRGLSVHPFRRVDDVEHLDRVAAQAPFAEVLRRSVLSTADRLRPVAVLLSGGLDSSAVLATVAGSGMDAKAYSVGYHSGGWQDERAGARSVAAHLGVPLAERVIGGLGFEELFRRTIVHLGEPVYTPVTISTFAVSELASAEHKVVLTGDGSDELLLGYDHFRRVLADSEAQVPWQGAYRGALGWLTEECRRRLLQPEMETTVHPGGDPACADPAVAATDSARRFEITQKLPEYHLSRVDRLSMAHGLEARVPFLRNAMLDWSLARPARSLVTDSAKQPLRDAMAAHLPAKVVQGPKQKFTAPVRAWLAGPLRELTRDLLDAADGAEALGLRADGVRWLGSEHAREPGSHAAATWGVLVMCAWYEFVFRALPAQRVR